jgi:catechol 2,3-dioxygenase-like lactoylglutathione lyase family enzyme
MPRFHLIGLVVADMAASLAFYRLLGLDVPADADAQPSVGALRPLALKLLVWRAQTGPLDDPRGHELASLALAAYEAAYAVDAADRDDTLAALGPGDVIAIATNAMPGQYGASANCARSQPRT